MVRVRFAPSPTGPLHIGGVRTCLYNYLFAKKQNGKLLLRIEDTDQTRFVPGAEEYIIEAFDWLGIQFDEGVHVGGPHAPYKQSERMELYREFADLLIQRGWSYYAFDTPQELEQRRKEAEAQKSTFQYDTQTRGSLCNSLTLSPEEVEERLKGDYVIRFKHPENQDITVNDLIRGEVVINTRILDDKVLFRSDGLPTYHLANIVDDHLMEITHVIRGEEWLPSAPLHVMLYRAFEWEAPQFAHLPLLLKPDGNGKLSKRDGDRLGFPVFPLEWKDPVTQEISSGYRESGYLPEAVINMLALLGWNPGNDQEVMSMEELIEQFSLDKVSKSGAKFDLDKARWFNHHYIQLCEEEQLASPLFLILKEKEIEASEEQVLKVISLVKERVYFMTEWWEQVHYFFVAPTEYNPDVIKKRWKENTAEHLQAIRQLLLTATSSEKEHLHTLITQYIQDHQLNMGQIMNCLRLTLVGDTKGVDLFEIVEFIGIEETAQRIERAILEIAK